VTGTAGVAAQAATVATARLAGKRALVTGAAQGLGETMAIALATEGCDVAAFDVRGEQLAAVADRIERLGRRAVPLEVDIRETEPVRDGVAQIWERWGGIDILVNNAGKGQREPFTELTREVWDYMLAVNLTSVFNVTHAVVPRMLEAGTEGRVITISSIAALRGGRLLGKSAYAAAKGGVIGFTKALAYELAPHKITVNCIAPGLHNTPRRAQDTPEERERIMPQIPMNELGEPTDLAQTVVFLSLPTSRYITGVVLPQDGGHSI
jgi:NAD(P)-dependent dehydrogenase (short-subunit alcohol dehydrogenase family)